MVEETGGAGGHYEPESVGGEHRVAVPPMTAAPHGLARSGGLRANAYQNTGQEGVLRGAGPRVLDPEAHARVRIIG
eukprot:3163347-Alexandrium_andersonii.AAC.1